MDLQTHNFTDFRADFVHVLWGFRVTKRWILGSNPRFKDFKQDLKI